MCIALLRVYCCLTYFSCRIAGQKSVSGRSCDQPPRLSFFFFCFPYVYKQMLRWFPKLQVATACFSCSPPDLNFLDPYSIFMYMHNNHCHRATAHLQLNVLLLLLLLLLLYWNGCWRKLTNTAGYNVHCRVDVTTRPCTVCRSYGMGFPFVRRVSSVRAVSSLWCPYCALRGDKRHAFTVQNNHSQLRVPRRRYIKFANCDAPHFTTWCSKHSRSS